MHKGGMKNQHFLQLKEGFIEWLERLNYAPPTIRSRQRHLCYFLDWIAERGIRRIEDIDRNDIRAYSCHLHRRPIKAKTIGAYQSVLKLLNEYLESYGSAPVAKVRLRVEREIKTERTILTKGEVKRLYDACENTLWGMRDRIILALFYGCGLRCREGSAVQSADVDFVDGVLHVRKGKNYRERYVPMSDGVSREIQNWMAYGLPFFCPKTNLLLPNTRGKVDSSGRLNKRLKILCKAADIDKHITLHCLRHSIATHLLQNGMELENIARFLGHKGLEATKIYTRIVNETDG